MHTSISSLIYNYTFESPISIILGGNLCINPDVLVLDTHLIIQKEREKLTQLNRLQAWICPSELLNFQESACE